MVNHPIHLPNLLSDCFLLLPFPFVLCAHIVDNVLLKVPNIDRVFFHLKLYTHVLDLMPVKMIPKE